VVVLEDLVLQILVQLLVVVILVDLVAVVVEMEIQRGKKMHPNNQVELKQLLLHQIRHTIRSLVMEEVEVMVVEMVLAVAALEVMHLGVEIMEVLMVQMVNHSPHLRTHFSLQQFHHR
jgi:hypothetical protein